MHTHLEGEWLWMAIQDQSRVYIQLRWHGCTNKQPLRMETSFSSESQQWTLITTNFAMSIAKLLEIRVDLQSSSHILTPYYFVHGDSITSENCGQDGLINPPTRPGETLFMVSKVLIFGATRTSLEIFPHHIKVVLVELGS